MLVLLLLVAALCCAQSKQDGNINPALYEAVQHALIKDKNNLMKLQSLFYPPEAEVFNFSIHSCAFTVKKINTSKVLRPAFGDCKCSLPRDRYCYNDKSGRYTNFIFSETELHAHQLYYYIANLANVLQAIDFVSVKLFTMLTFSSQTSNMLQYSSNHSQSRQGINLSVHIDELDVMPSLEGAADTLIAVLTWAKYYARSQGILTVPRLDSDILIINKYNYDYLYDGPGYGYLLAVTYIIIVSIAISGIYGLFKILQLIRINRKNIKEMTYDIREFYWATVLVCGAINLACFILSLCFALDLVSVYMLAPIGILLCVEVISVWIIVKDFSSLSFISNRYILRAIHTLATCQILWFLHRFTCNLIVALYFIALAPTQTLAAISLIYSVVFCTIIYVAYNLHCLRRVSSSMKRCCKIACKVFIVFVLYFGTIGVLFCLTMIFNQLAANGLASSGLGSVILSLVAPTTVFLITMSLKGQVKKFFQLAKSQNDVENVSESIEDSDDVESTDDTPSLMNNV